MFDPLEQRTSTLYQSLVLNGIIIILHIIYASYFRSERIAMFLFLHSLVQNVSCSNAAQVIVKHSNNNNNDRMLSLVFVLKETAICSVDNLFGNQNSPGSTIVRSLIKQVGFKNNGYAVTLIP